MKIPQTKRYSIYKNLVLQDERTQKLNFKHDGRKHYVYRVTDYTRTEKQHYYGSHTPKKRYKGDDLIEEFWTYKTSSKYNTLNENKKENYKVKIIKVFDNPADKIIYESFLHQYFNVKINNYFWNESNQTPFGFNTTGKLGYKRPKHSELMKGKGNSFYGKKHSEKTINILKNIDRSGVGIKISMSKNIITDNGKTVMENATEKRIKTMTTKNSDGETIYEKSGRKSGITRKLRGSQKGEKSGKTKEIHIFNSKHELMYISKIAFPEFCKLNNLPLYQLSNSYLRDGESIFQTDTSKRYANKNKQLLFIGWYAKIIKN